jgi:hypothetical protein
MEMRSLIFDYADKPTSVYRLPLITATSECRFTHYKTNPLFCWTSEGEQPFLLTQDIWRCSSLSEGPRNLLLQRLE